MCKREGEGGEREREREGEGGVRKGEIEREREREGENDVCECGREINYCHSDNLHQKQNKKDSHPFKRHMHTACKVIQISMTLMCN